MRHIALAIWILVVSLCLISDGLWAKKVNVILLSIVKEMSISRAKIDSLTEEIGYLKGLEELCFPVATR